eukprot:TRINITY_DN1298_c0_g1_i1.p2 TRINITY_DN1298_c0_g1~~TRINITY_DN1298_c0_g1_i1.p2  ORF type:complete len:264 (+),score=54.95 TRINITY_DN1298_c0_g1_i1:1611-2402(+)
MYTKHEEIRDYFDDDFDPLLYQPQYSGKMKVLDILLCDIKNNTDDCVVLVSFSKKTLNYFEIMCTANNFQYLRLDGDTKKNERQDLVDRFNRRSGTFLFLLSAKAGGEGLNLIGGNHLILFDCDWNPSIGKQAMARVWRDGQKRDVTIYRLFTTGTIEEKILQRQSIKTDMSNQLIDLSSFGKAQFNKKDYEKIFQLQEETPSETLELSMKATEQGIESAFENWNHVYPGNTGTIFDNIEGISFQFEKNTNPTNYVPEEQDEN